MQRSRVLGEGTECSPSWARRLGWALSVQWIVLSTSPARAQDFTLDFPVRADAGDQYGAALAAVGDVNGDGIPDLVVGAPEPALHDQPGYADVLSGRDGSVLSHLVGAAPGDCFGISVDGAGDVDHDGHPDILVGAFNWFRFIDDSTHYGYARVLSGKDGTVLREVHGDASAPGFGRRVAQMGDLDADGYPDFAVASPHHRLVLGRVRVFSGKTGSVLFEFVGHNIQDAFGESISSGGDLDGDGVPDILVGDPGGKINELGMGVVTAYSGKDGSVLFEIKGVEAHAQLGLVVRGGRDVDGDGKPDILVGAGDKKHGPEMQPHVSLYSGATHALLFTIGTTPGTFTPGRSIAFAGDLNHDGHEDLLVADPDPSGGVVRVYSGTDGTTILAELHSDELMAHFGTAVCSLGDTDGDGVPDIAIGAHWSTLKVPPTGSFAIGKAFVFSGGDSSLRFSKSGGH